MAILNPLLARTSLSVTSSLVHFSGINSTSKRGRDIGWLVGWSSRSLCLRVRARHGWTAEGSTETDRHEGSIKTLALSCRGFARSLGRTLVSRPPQSVPIYSLSLALARSPRRALPSLAPLVVCSPLNRPISLAGLCSAYLCVYVCTCLYMYRGTSGCTNRLLNLDRCTLGVYICIKKKVYGSICRRAFKGFFYKDAPLDEIIEEREARVQSMQAFLTEIL